MRPDFSREVSCVLGLPFDNVSEEEAEHLLRRAVQTRTRCFLSTPNLNFAIGCLNDPQFRQSVLDSDLSVADGWPIVAIARLTGAAVAQRVTGSGLFARLERSTQRPAVSVFLFGGPDGAAGQACSRLNAAPAGVTCVGFDSPGFGTIEQLSSNEQLARINAANADFVVVALGAQKGQAWIRRNLDRINAPVVSHLGAVINFAAGTVARAPDWIQNLHLEWLWRVKEEPLLWRRYARDGIALLRLLATRVLPFALDQWFARVDHQAAARAVAHLRPEANGSVLLTLEGGWTRANVAKLRPLLSQASETDGAVIVNLTQTVRIDSAAIAQLMLLQAWLVRNGRAWRISGASSRVRRSLRLACADYLLDPV